MNKELYKAAKQALDEADQDYLGEQIECGEIPERATELLKHRFDCIGQRVHTRCFWIDDKDADLDSALSETIEFCMEHQITSYAVVNYSDKDFVFVVYFSKGGENA